MLSLVFTFDIVSSFRSGFTGLDRDVAEDSSVALYAIQGMKRRGVACRYAG